MNGNVGRWSEQLLTSSGGESESDNITLLVLQGQRDRVVESWQRNRRHGRGEDDGRRQGDDTDVVGAGCGRKVGMSDGLVGADRRQLGEDVASQSNVPTDKSGRNSDYSQSKKPTVPQNYSPLNVLSRGDNMTVRNQRTTAKESGVGVVQVQHIGVVRLVRRAVSVDDPAGAIGHGLSTQNAQNCEQCESLHFLSVCWITTDVR